MVEQRQEEVAVRPHPRNQRNGVTRWVLVVGMALVVFCLGYAVGNGNIFLQNPIAANKNLSDRLDYSSVDEMYKELRAYYDGELDEEALIDGMRRGMVAAAGDAYTQFFSQLEAKEFQEQLSGSFSGIGAELSKDAESSAIVVVAPISGFPAEKAGLRARDQIIAIDDATTASMGVDEAVSKIRGEAGTKVKLNVLRGSERLEFTITRAEINIPSVEYEVKDGVGYIRISRFWTDTAGLVRKAADEINQQGVNRVVLDLRSNPGGSVDAAVDVVSLWLQRGDVVLEEKRGGKIESTLAVTSRSNPLRGKKTVVLIDGGSASASEIVAGALADHGVATLVGTKSYGKGSVQTIRNLRDGSQAKITFARWFTPSGRNIDQEGIEPEVVVELSEQDIESQNDRQKTRAFEIVRQ